MKKIALSAVVAVFVLLGGVTIGYSQSGNSNNPKAEAIAKAELEKAEKAREQEEKKQRIKENYASEREDLQIKLSKSIKDRDIAKKDKNMQMEQKRTKDVASLKKQMADLQKNYEQNMKQFE